MPTTDACQDVTAVKDHQTYSIKITSQQSLAENQARCERIRNQLDKRTKKIEGFWALTSDRSCETNGDTVTLHVKLNEMSLSYVSHFSL